jgi:hypothetical protein
MPMTIPKEKAVFKVFECSTVHLMPDDYYAVDGYLAQDTEFGLIVPVPENFRDWGLPEKAMQILKMAQDLGCAWVLLNRDGPLINGLETYFDLWK